MLTITMTINYFFAFIQNSKKWDSQKTTVMPSMDILNKYPNQFVSGNYAFNFLTPTY